MAISGKMRRDTKGFLQDILVLDMADERGSFCSKLLADLGATVIKVESPQSNPSRKIGPFYSPDPDKAPISLSYFYNNTNKLGTALNLDRLAGRRALCGLLEKADVLVETFYPGYLEKLPENGGRLRGGSRLN